MSDFDKKLGALCVQEMAEARNDPERTAKAIESLTDFLAMQIAFFFCGAEPHQSELAEGTSAYLFDRIAEHVPAMRQLRSTLG